jgi:signal peptidase I
MAIALLAIVQVACGQQYTRVKQNGYSMMPNFTDGDVFKIDEVPLTDLKRGDIILIEKDGKLLIKRLIGLPNESVSIHDGKVFINGSVLDEPYEVVPPPYRMSELLLTEDAYFVLGDNRADSSDSHQWGPVKGSDIKGKAIPE